MVYVLIPHLNLANIFMAKPVELADTLTSNNLGNNKGLEEEKIQNDHTHWSLDVISP